MKSSKTFGIIGGDLRQIYVYKALIQKGYKAMIYGFDTLPPEYEIIATHSLRETASFGDFVILPLPVTRDKKSINAPFALSKINLDDDFYRLLQKKTVFGGIISSIENKVKNEAKQFYDYAQREDFMVLNAAITAEGAVSAALSETKRALGGARCLVAGFGRIGKFLAKTLKNMEASVTVSARRAKDFAWISAMGYKAAIIDKNIKNLDYDIIFNTVPSVIFDKYVLSKCTKNTTIIDLASAPGGTDTDAAKKLGIKVIPSPGLPGRFFPESAGKIIADTILKITEEENL